jgi:alkanesulfonate monooxygenase
MPSQTDESDQADQTPQSRQAQSRPAQSRRGLRFHWFLPTSGDGRDIVGGGHGVTVGAAGAIRPPTVPYLGQIARSAEQLGFEGALTPTGAWCEDAWLTTAMLTEVTERLKFLVAFRPGQISPTLSAQMASTFQRQSRGRLLLNVVTGGESAEQRAYGDFLDKEGRYERTGEFLDIVRRLWAGENVTHDGTHLRVEGAKLTRLPDPVPDVYFGGSSAAAGPVAAKHSDVYLTWGEPPAQADEKLRWISSLAEAEGRTVRLGIRLHTISRDTPEEAWRQAERLIEPIDDAMIAKAQAGLSHSESEGQRRMRELHAGGDRKDLRDLEIYPNLWAGVGLVRGGAGTALVGSHTEVADRIEEYAGLGITEFIMSGYPCLEEAYWFGEGVLPILERRGLWAHPAPLPADITQTAVPFAPTHAPAPVPVSASEPAAEPDGKMAAS